MKLTKTVPSHQKSFEATSCVKEFSTMNPKFRAIREKSRNPMDKCHWCKHVFDNGEMMALALCSSGNKVLCQSCADKLIASGNGK